MVYLLYVAVIDLMPSNVLNDFQQRKFLEQNLIKSMIVQL